MMKEKEWLRERIEKLKKKADERNSMGLVYSDEERALQLVGIYVSELGEPETLAKEWIEKNAEYADAISESSCKDVAVVRIDKLQNLLVPKQEKPTIPQFVADWIEELKDNEVNLLDNIYDFTHTDTIHDYIREHGDNLMKAWLAYPYIEVEKEQKYWVKLLNHNDGYLRLWRKKGDSEWQEGLGSSWYEETSGYKFEYKQEFTKEEILALDKGDIYFEHFAVRVEGEVE